LFVLYGVITRQIEVQEAIASLKRGRQAKRLTQWSLETDWENPLEEVRQKLGISPPEQDPLN